MAKPATSSIPLILPPSLIDCCALTDEDRRRQMGLLGRERLAKRFSLDVQVRQMLALYERALAMR